MLPPQHRDLVAQHQQLDAADPASSAIQPVRRTNIR
jgi:hypothetical protein